MSMVVTVLVQTLPSLVNTAQMKHKTTCWLILSGSLDNIGALYLVGGYS